MFVGSGGNVEAYARAAFTGPTGARSPVLGRKETIKHSELAKSMADMISEIKAALGMNVTQLAKALQVERQTVYYWMNETETPRIQPRNRERLRKVHALSEQWNQLCKRPAGKWLDNLEIEGRKLMDLLSEDTLDESVIHQAMEAISTKINEEIAIKKERSVAERLRRKGFQPPPGGELRTTLTAYSGTVFTPEN